MNKKRKNRLNEQNEKSLPEVTSSHRPVMAAQLLLTHTLMSLYHIRHDEVTHNLKLVDLSSRLNHQCWSVCHPNLLPTFTDVCDYKIIKRKKLVFRVIIDLNDFFVFKSREAGMLYNNVHGSNEWMSRMSLVNILPWGQCPFQMKPVHLFVPTWRMKMLRHVQRAACSPQ